MAPGCAELLCLADWVHFLWGTGCYGNNGFHHSNWKERSKLFPQEDAWKILIVYKWLRKIICWWLSYPNSPQPPYGVHRPARYLKDKLLPKPPGNPNTQSKTRIPCKPFSHLLQELNVSILSKSHIFTARSPVLFLGPPSFDFSSWKPTTTESRECINSETPPIYE